MKAIGTPSACSSSWAIVDSMCAAYLLFLSSCLRLGGMVSTGCCPLPTMHPLCALYAPSMRPLCALYAPSMRLLCAQCPRHQHFQPTVRIVPRGHQQRVPFLFGVLHYLCTW